MLKKTFRALAVASAVAISAGSAHAVTVSYQGSDPFGGNGRASATVTSTVDPTATLSAVAGGFNLKGDIYGNGEVNFVAWCLDIVGALANNKDYVITNTPFAEDVLTALQITNIGKLFDTAYSTLNLAITEQSAGFQLALWEIVYEDPANAFDLKTGNLSVTSTSSVLDAGQAFLDNLGVPVEKGWNLAFLQNTNGTQNLVTATPVPVPAAAGLLLLALGGLGAVGRRRRSA